MVVDGAFGGGPGGPPYHAGSELGPFAFRLADPGRRRSVVVPGSLKISGLEDCWIAGFSELR